MTRFAPTRIIRSRFAQTAGALALGALAALAFVQTQDVSPKPAPRMSFELDDGVQEVGRSGTSHAVAFVWTRPDAVGNPIETWVLFRERMAEGWLYPGANNPDVTIQFKHKANASPTSLTDFLDWCEAQYPASMNVDKSLDFTVHEHSVEIL